MQKMHNYFFAFIFITIKIEIKYIQYIKLLKQNTKILLLMIENISISFINSSVQIDKGSDEIEKLFISNKMGFIEHIMHHIIEDIKTKNPKHKTAKFYKVGGSNRDVLLNIESKDFDIVVTHAYDVPDDQYFEAFHQFMECFKHYGAVSNNNPEKEKNETCETKFITYKFVPTIIDKNNTLVTKMMFEKYGLEPIDIVSARTEVLTHKIGYHESFVPKYSHNISVQDDLDRRDFIINAIAKKIGTEEYFFPHGYNLDTIKHVFAEKVLIAVNLENLIFDPTRMLRAIQLCGRLDFELEKYTYGVIKKYSHFVKHLKMEKVEKEMIKMCAKSVNLKRSTLYFIHSGLFHRLFDAKNSTNTNDTVCSHLNLDNLVNEFHHYPHQRNKISVSVEETQNTCITPLFTKIFDNDELYQINKNNRFCVMMGLFGFLSTVENELPRSKDGVIKIIKNNITNNTDSILFIDSIIELCGIIFENFIQKKDYTDESLNETVAKIETFISYVYGNAKLKNNINLYLHLIKMYDLHLYKQISKYTNFIHEITKNIKETKVVDINSECKNISDICIPISEQNSFLNRKEIHNTIKKTFFLYNKYEHQNKPKIEDKMLATFKKNKNLDHIIRDRIDTTIKNMSQENISNIIHHIILQTYMILL
jgi:tRNA nucleotidyltransferase/poly(A) polymerase